VTDTEVLLGAADLIERNGLYKCTYWPGWPASYFPGYPCCALGAIRVITNDSGDRGSLAKLEDAIGGSIARWSDSHTQAQVVATLRAVGKSSGRSEHGSTIFTRDAGVRPRRR
jgi:hypothetical protein